MSDANTYVLVDQVSDETEDFVDYADAVRVLNELVRGYEHEGLKVDYGFASQDNLAAVRVSDGVKSLYLSIELDQS